MPKAVKLPSGSYRVQVSATQNGKKIRKSFTAPTAKAALRYAEDWQQHIKMIGTDSTVLTVEEAVTEYINVKQNVLSASTITAYIGYLKNGFNDLKHYKLYQLNSIIIQKSINAASAKIAPKTVKNYYRLLTAALKMFYPELMLSLTFPKKLNEKKRVFSLEYISNVIKAVQDTDIEIPVLCAMTLSCRASETSAFCPCDIDFENHTVEINKARVRSGNAYIIQKKNKNETSYRVVALPDILYNALLKYKKAPPDEFICPIEPNRYWQHFNRALKKAGLERMSFHDLRHVNASIMLSLGINSQIQREIGGWSTDHIMKSVYHHSFSEDRIYANNLINNRFNALISDNTSK